MASKHVVWPGRPYPLGANLRDGGVNFALFSEHASRVVLCLFDEEGDQEIDRIELKERTDQVWHCFLPELKLSTLYAYRVDGPWKPEEGHRFNFNKLLLDPYAKCIHGEIIWDDANFAYRVGHADADLSFDKRDNARFMPKGRIIGRGTFDWEDDALLRRPWHDTIIYELHVKGFTELFPHVRPEIRGSYAALGSQPAIDYLEKLGVTAVELMPVHTFVDDRHLMEKGLHNYWGYNSIGFFAPDNRYSAFGQVAEFKAMVKALHRAGIEVIIDVVYNHTAEGSHLGPTLSFRGIDNASYYRLVPNNRRYYFDYTGTGNTLNMMHPRVLQLIMDSLRYWVLDMHVDGFRFDLAAALARELHEVDRLSAFFDIIHQDPVLSQVKLIAEPWDLGEGGYQVGNFPIGWTEWNGKYRDAVRAYWKGEPNHLGELGYRLTGSSDIYEHGGRRPYASINFVTAHDGFTLQDLVSYNHKHNEVNGEGNRDGSDHNLSWNCGAEGPSEWRHVRICRQRQKRNFLATLLLSQGVPMLLAGDEIGHSQSGNNNAYCQDNRISWLDWELDLEQQSLLNFVRGLIALRCKHPSFRRSRFFQGKVIRGSGAKDLLWFEPNGREMSEVQWNEDGACALALFLAGDGIEEYDRQGGPLADDDFVLLLNAGADSVRFCLPSGLTGPWRKELDTTDGSIGQGSRVRGRSLRLAARSLVLLRKPKER